MYGKEGILFFVQTGLAWVGWLAGLLVGWVAGWAGWLPWLAGGWLAG